MDHNPPPHNNKKRNPPPDDNSERYGSKRSRTTNNSKIVQDHYNNRENQTRADRNKSTISNLRKFNNWIKTVLIKEYCREGHCVMDICGGKGGDLRKWLESRIYRLVFSDIADVSLRHAIDRYNQMASSENKKIERVPAFAPTFICANCHKPGIKKELDKLGVNFDLVSCQFALHYSFETEETARQFLQNVSYRLKPNGFFVATLPSAARIVERIRKSPDGLRFGNQYYTIEFPKRDNFPRFGAKYTFTLEDAIDGVPEYLVHHETLVNIAKECGLEFKKKQNFQEFYTETRNPCYESLEKIVRDGQTGPLDPDFWEIAGIYNVYVFQKSPDPAFRLPEGVALLPSWEFRMWNYSDIIHVGDGVAASTNGVRDTPVTTTTTMSNPPPPTKLMVERTVPPRSLRVNEKPQGRVPPPRNGRRDSPKEFHSGNSRRDSPKEFHSGNSRNGPKDSLKEFHSENSRNGPRNSLKDLRPGNSVRSRSGSSSPSAVIGGGGDGSPGDDEGALELELPGDLRKEVLK